MLIGYGELDKVLLEIAKVSLLTSINLLGSVYFLKKKPMDSYLTPIIFPLFDKRKIMKHDSFLENNSKSLLRVLLQGNNIVCAILFLFFKNISPLFLGIWIFNSFFLITKSSYLQVNIQNHLIFLSILSLSVELFGYQTIE